ncbi:MAG: Xylan alpha,2-glucuronidase [Verrucomicrobiales bacterium]|nr:Xylan alpha,2-glucuronidase [Verrucomicrobiales bacterium]
MNNPRFMKLSLSPRVLSVLSAAAFAMPASHSGAAVLYSFGTTDSATAPSDDGFVAADVTTTALPGITAPSGGAAIAAGGVGLVRFWNSEWAGFTITSDNGLLIDNATEFNTGYLSFSVAAAPGTQLDLSTLTFNSARGGAAGTRGFEIYATVNGAAFDFASRVPLLALTDEPGTRVAPNPRSADLSGAGFQGINSVTFRYYPLTPANGNSVDFSGMTLNGAVVPEPTVALMLPLAGMLAWGARRRRA